MPPHLPIDFARCALHSINILCLLHSIGFRDTLLFVGIQQALWALMTAVPSLAWRWPHSSCAAVAALLLHYGGRAPLAWHWPRSSHAVIDTILLCGDGSPHLVQRRLAYTALNQHLWRSPLSWHPPHPLGVYDITLLSLCCGHAPLMQ